MKRSTLLLTAVLILLFLLGSCALTPSVYYKVGPQKVVSVVRNVGCLKCHPEQLKGMVLSSTHEPFVTRHCTSCHNQHSRLVRTTSTAPSLSVGVKTWLRWGPLRWVLDSADKRYAGSTKPKTTLWRASLGPATLVVSRDRLCWTCHAGLAKKTTMTYQHPPFGGSDCMSCHNPHASSHPTLLKSSLDQICFTCHPSVGPQLQRAFGHPPAVQRDCIGCHDPHSSNHAGLLKAAQRDLCFTCHASVAYQSVSMPTQHQPFEGDNCTGCHQPHGSNYSSLLRQESPQLCYRCHTALQARFKRASHHPVGTKLDCSSCHQAHASAYSGLLNDSQFRLCTGCHKQLGALASMPVQHQPFSGSECTGCHTPHGSDYTPMLKSPQPTLCFKCHPSMRSAIEQPSHHPRECTKCHRVHASQYESLLVQTKTGNKLCSNCHDPITAKYASSKHKSNACFECHRVHGSQYANLLKEGFPEICIQCHNTSEQDYVGKNRHFATPEYLDNQSGKPLTCTSTCHDPHGSPYGHMGKNGPTNKDGTCLQCHAKVGIYF